MKRFTSLILTLAIMLSMLACMSVPAFATEGAPEMDATMEEAMAIAAKLEQIKAYVEKITATIQGIIAKVESIPQMIRGYVDKALATYQGYVALAMGEYKKLEAKVVATYQGTVAWYVNAYHGAVAKVVATYKGIEAKVVGAYRNAVAKVTATVNGAINDFRVGVTNITYQARIKIKLALEKIKSYSISNTLALIKSKIDGVLGTVGGVITSNNALKGIANFILTLLAIIILPILFVIGLAVFIVAAVLALVVGLILLIASAVLGLALLFV